MESLNIPKTVERTRHYTAHLPSAAACRNYHLHASTVINYMSVKLHATRSSEKGVSLMYNSKMIVVNTALCSLMQQHATSSHLTVTLQKQHEQQPRSYTKTETEDIQHKILVITINSSYLI